MTEQISVLNERIEDVSNLQYLKKYACHKSAYCKDWYLKCLDCGEFKKCKVGQRAAVLMDIETSTHKIESPQKIQEDKKRTEISDIFSMKDPIRYLLETSMTVRPQSIYTRVNSWRKNYPDLEEKYHMIEKVRFLWTKPYDSMSVPDILKMLYPEDKKKEETKVESDDVSLEDFLQEQKEPKPVEKKASSSREDIGMLIEKLEREKSSLEKRIQELDKQISAVRMTVDLMNAMV